MHNIIEEILVINSGKLKLEWIENNQVLEENIHKNSVVRMRKAIHRLINEEDDECYFTVFRIVPNNVDNSKKIKSDKITFSQGEIKLITRMDK